MIIIPILHIWKFWLGSCVNTWTTDYEIFTLTISNTPFFQLVSLTTKHYTQSLNACLTGSPLSWIIHLSAKDNKSLNCGCLITFVPQSLEACRWLINLWRQQNLNNATITEISIVFKRYKSFMCIKLYYPYSAP